MTGQSLIRAAELRAVVSERQRHGSSMMAFRDKYSARPGDFRDATRFWGRATSSADCVTNSAAAITTPGTCDGNGNGFIASAAAGSQSGEAFQAWKQLALAGMIEGAYTGLAGSTTGGHSIIGENVPASKIPQAGWSVVYFDPLYGGNSQTYAMDYGSAMMFGQPYTLTSGDTSYTFSVILKAEEAWGIDTKLDDGLPARGQLIGTGIFYPLSALDPCSLANSGTAGATNHDTRYNVGSSKALCGFIFRNAY